MRHAFIAIGLAALSTVACLELPLPGGEPSAAEPWPAPSAPPLVPEGTYRTIEARLRPIPPPPEPTPAPPLPPSPPGFPVPRGLTEPVFDGLPDPPAAIQPIIGGTLLVLRGGTTAIAADPDRDRIFVTDLEQATLRREIVLEPGSVPGRLVEDASGRVFVVLRNGGKLLTLAPGTFDVLESRAVCPAPRGLAVLPDGSRVYVACAGGELVALPTSGGAPLWTRRLERDLRDIVLDAGGKTLLVSTFRAARLLVSDLEGNVREELTAPTSLNLTRRDRAGVEGPATTRFTPSVAWRTLAAPGGGAVMLHQRGFTGEIPADSSTADGRQGYGGAGCGGVVQSVVSSIPLAGQRRPSPQISGAVLMVDVALSRDGRMAIAGPSGAYAPHLGSFVVVGPLEQATAINDEGCVGAGQFPIGVMDLPWSEGDRGQVNVHSLTGELVAVAFDGRDDLVVQVREPAEVRVPNRSVRIALSAESRASLGQAIFHANTGVGITCASCHPEGGEDGRVWRFVKLGPRRTQSLRGGMSETAPLHWDGDMADLAHIAREVFTGRMGGPQLSQPATDALARWIDAIPLLPPSPPGDPAAVARGEALFLSARTGCASCHSGPRLTNNIGVDVGTGRVLQVPSLRGLGARAPYMHTGCAPSLASRFSAECGGGDRHGVTSTLDAQQAADLQAYLESL